MEGSEALAEAGIAAGCRFFAGYPMTPFTEVLESFAKKLPNVGGTCINAESELEAVGMAWGAAATGARAATGSCGQGLALMQESFSEMVRAELPVVIFNMARGQGDYYQTTRGGGHGDYRIPSLAPVDLAEAVELTQLAFHLADKWRNPVILYGDYLIAHTWESVEVAPLDLGALPPKDWASTGERRPRGESRMVTSLGMERGGEPISNVEEFWKILAEKSRRIAAEEQRLESGATEGAELVVVAFGSAARFARYAVQELRREGIPVGWARPITLWPFPAEALRRATEGARKVAVFELNAGQMIDDVRLAVMGRAEVCAIGGISTDRSQFGVGPLLDAALIRDRIERALRGEEVPA
jgi:2-oxoglutarate ferredoxin oxidoreductase subunit alpha